MNGCERRSTQFLFVHAMSAQKIAALVRELEVDIAVDLNGFTKDARSSIFVRRPAPVQVNYLGYPGTLGHPCWDYIIADRFLIPQEVTALCRKGRESAGLLLRQRCSEGCRSTPSRARPGCPSMVWCSAASTTAYKITPDVFDIWMRLLRAVEGSVLWLSGANPSAVENLRIEAGRRAVAPERLVFAPKIPSMEDHLARHRLADLLLDTLYYNAHTTAIDALWAGLPVLTCSGTAFASRGAGSLLTAVGLPELITHSLPDYEALALRLARDGALLTAIKQKLARNRDAHRCSTPDALRAISRRPTPACGSAVSGANRRKASPLPHRVENIAGAGGMTGSNRVARAAPDGYQFVFGTSGTHAYNQSLYKNPLYNSATDFAPVGIVAQSFFALIVRKDFPADTLAEFIAYAKANDARMQFGSAGPGSATHIVCVLLNNAMGTKVTHVPYRSTSQAVQDLVAGRIDFVCDAGTTALPLIQGQVVKGLANLGPRRALMLPALATAKEQGLVGVEVYGWNAFFVPKGTPAPIVRALNKAAGAMLEMPSVHEQWRKLGLEVPAPEIRSSEYLARHVVSEIATWAAPIKASGVSMD